MSIINITSLQQPEVQIFSTLTEAQLRNRIEPEKASLSWRVPKSYEWRWTLAISL